MGIHCFDGYYVALLTKEDVVLANSVPSKEKKDAETAFSSFPEDVRSRASLANVAFETKVAKLLVDLFLHPEEFWEVSLSIKIETTAPVLLSLRRQTNPGSVLTYSELAKLALGNEKAARSVGTAMKRNRWPILVPCHRVVKADGHLGNYSGAGGQQTKRELLDREGAKLDAKKQKLAKD